VTIQDEKIAAAGLSVLDAARFAGVGRSTIYEELAAGRLRAVKVGRRTIIPQLALVDWMAGLPAYRAPSTSNKESPSERYPRRGPQR
jgi:excisionase family DNA binding protein